MKQPGYLVKGDKVAIVSPAGIVKKDDVEKAIEIMREWGLIPVTGENTYGSNGFYSGSIEERLSDFQQELNNSEIKAIFCSRGGYGSVHLLARLDFSNFKKNPKWIIGYSDITVFHSYLFNNGIESIHGIMPKTFGDVNQKQSVESLRKLLFGDNPEYKIQSNPLNRQGKVNGILCGGNLSLIYSLRGTPFQLNPDDAILFIEDVDENIYHIDRMMMNLKYGGVLAKIEGLVVGGMIKIKDTAPSYGQSANEIILNAVKEFNYPVMFDFQAGHMHPNFALILGRKISLSVGSQECKISFEK